LRLLLSLAQVCMLECVVVCVSEGVRASLYRERRWRTGVQVHRTGQRTPAPSSPHHDQIATTRRVYLAARVAWARQGRGCALVTVARALLWRVGPMPRVQGGSGVGSAWLRGWIGLGPCFACGLHHFMCVFFSFWPILVIFLFIPAKQEYPPKL
jgi:hypothetical protein